MSKVQLYIDFFFHLGDVLIYWLLLFFYFFSQHKAWTKKKKMKYDKYYLLYDVFLTDFTDCNSIFWKVLLSTQLEYLII